jgi:hypothetical protein
MMLLRARRIAHIPVWKSSVHSQLTRRVCSYASTPCLSSTRPRHVSRATPQRWHQVAHVRGAKRKATLTLTLDDDVPQGMIKAKSPPLPDIDDEEPEYPPLLQQVRNNMLKFSHCVVVTRVGGFYEVFVC